jgi:phosphoserine phosphatase
MRAKYPLVFFDVDSTLVTIEGIDALARGNPEIARLTEAAMNGEIPLEEVYERRLEMIRPDRRRIEALGEEYVAAIVPGAREVVSALTEGGATVHLVTAGIRQAILPLARHLGIPERAVHAVTLRFDERGSYAGFERSALTRRGGKELAILDVRARSHGESVFVGDGITDVEAKDAVDLFIGYGGVRQRERVRELAPVYITDPDLTAILPYVVEER